MLPDRTSSLISRALSPNRSSSGSPTERNVCANGLAGRVTTDAVALAAHDGLRQPADNDHGSALNGLTGPEGRLVSVPCQTFASAVAAAGGRVDLVKPDTEGAEYSIVLGSRPEEWADVRAVVIEYHDAPGRSSAELAGYFGRAGLPETAHVPATPRQGTVWPRRAAP